MNDKNERFKQHLDEFAKLTDKAQEATDLFVIPAGEFAELGEEYTTKEPVKWCTMEMGTYSQSSSSLPFFQGISEKVYLDRIGVIRFHHIDGFGDALIEFNGENENLHPIAKISFLPIPGVPKGESHIYNLEHFTVNYLKDVISYLDYRLDPKHHPDKSKRTSQQDVETKSGCFIATACYGAENAFEIEVLRSFRNRYLSTTRLGNVLLRFYYRVSPRIAQYLQKHTKIRQWTRIYILDKIVNIILKYSQVQKDRFNKTGF